MKQLTKIDSTTRTINGMEAVLSSEYGIPSTRANKQTYRDPDFIPATFKLNEHVYISGSTANFFHLGSWCEEHDSDPAAAVRISQYIQT